MDFLEKLKKSLIANSILRNSIVILIMAGCLSAAGVAMFEIRAILLVVALVMLAILLCGLALFGISHFSVAKRLFLGDDGKMDTEERKTATYFVIGVWIGICLLVGLTTIGIYMMQTPKGF